MSVNRGNAHVRGSAKRSSPENEASDAERLLNDPAFQLGYNRVRDGTIRMLEDLKSDGSPETEAVERELCRTLRTLKHVRRAIAAGIQGQQLRLAGFKASEPDKE